MEYEAEERDQVDETEQPQDGEAGQDHLMKSRNHRVLFTHGFLSVGPLRRGTWRRAGYYYERVRQTFASFPPAKRKVTVSAWVCLRSPRCRVVSNR